MGTREQAAHDSLYASSWQQRDGLQNVLLGWPASVWVFLMLVTCVHGELGALTLAVWVVHVQEADDVVQIGYLNALFVVARSIGLVGHALDQKRLQQGLYRHPWEDVLYTS